MSLNKKLKNLIKEKKAISVAEFMQYVIADKEYGYYASNQIFGESGDFITAPEISQIFGEIIGLYIAYKWLESGSPKEYYITELGPGRAELMSDILRATRKIPGFHKAIKINLIEISERLKKIQQDKLSEFNISWYSNFFEIPQEQGFIVANEFFDALPTCQFIAKDNKWHERMISLDEQENYIFTLNNRVSLNNGLINFPVGKDNEIYEYSNATITIMDMIAKYLKKTNSSAIIIDYGYLEDGIGDTLQAVKNHKYHDIFQDVGEADLTVHVDFSLLIRSLQENKIQNYHVTTQRNFLLQYGIKEREQILLQNSSHKQQEQIKIATQRLIDRDKMGELFKVLIVN